MIPSTVWSRVLSMTLLASLVAAGCGPSTKEGDIELADGVNAYRARRWGEAVSLLQRALAVQPDCAAARKLMAAALLREGRLDEAETAYLMAGEADPVDADIKVGLAQIAYHRNRQNDAERLFAEAAATPNAPTSTVAAAWNGLAVISQERHNAPLYRLYLLRALLADENYAPACYNLGVYYLTAIKDNEAALKCFERYANCVDINDPYRGKGAERAKRLMADLENERLVSDGAAAVPFSEISHDLDAAYDALVAKRYDAAVRCFHKVLSKDSRNFSAHLGLATTLQRLGRKSEALEEFEAASRSRPEHRESRLGAAELAFSLKRYDRAEEILGRALAYWPYDCEMLRRLSAIYQASGRREAARAYGSLALALPDGADPAFEQWLQSF